MQQDQLKQKVANAALEYVVANSVVGVGSGSTVGFFIDALANMRSSIEGVVVASEQSAKRCHANGIEVLDLNSVNKIKVYIDGADEVNAHKQMIKGGGAALTREKIVAAASEKFICIADVSKEVKILGKFPLAIEVIPMARSYVARQIVKLGGDPDYRQGVVTDNGNVIIDVHNFKILDPVALETQLNNIAGVVSNGVFAQRPADVVLLAASSGIKQL